METVSNPTAARVLAVRPVGTMAVLAELAGLHDVLALQALLLEHPFPGQVDVLAAAETVLVKADSPQSARRIAARLPELDLAVQAQAEGKLVQIDTVYDGEDLAEVGRLTGLGVEGVVAAHTGQVWTVAFGGFAPGFGYMVGENESLEVPRRSSPRTAVPAGSVALAGNYSAVYPRQSPGGWQLIGRTAARMWDLGREQPALAAPGDRVQFRAVRELVEVTDPASPAESVTNAGVQSGLRILSPGLQSLIQDLGRHGHGGLGVSVAGALDRSSLRRANRIVGNQPSAAVVETVAGGLRVQAVGDQVLTVTGAPVALTIAPPSEVHGSATAQDNTAESNTAEGKTAGDSGDWSWQERHAPMATAFALLDGEVLTLGAPERGFRTYLAVRGGVDTEPVLGSRSTDTMSGIGPAPLAAGGFIRAGKATSSNVVGNPEVQPDFPDTGVTVLDIVPGPRDDWFDAAALESLCSQDWTVTPRSNRVGMRLDGKALKRSRNGELASEGTVAGALQIPPEGQPVLFLADHPITGGYPVAAVVVDHQLDLAAQVPIGGRIRFRWAPGYTLPANSSQTSPDATQTK
ncbi:KipI family sensor histidine kinase inhibitor [Pseudarthrobacter siccitolerans]|uniref:KipI family sensor histidine kinase inhibitor n=1 Tax=Pseudarthrobacter siccitolerans TaxID=861266 RepID=A0ABU0PMV7_9MICC|nr:carboxyltransferase domain-containing protein [Pseudarthrobacter siccitolerans]MDQ0675296.1 KipI family sensor histidine kinase inhibitor [Pseudarthrobacter siccitolerans]